MHILCIRFEKANQFRALPVQTIFYSCEYELIRIISFLQTNGTDTMTKKSASLTGKEWFLHSTYKTSLLIGYSLKKNWNLQGNYWLHISFVEACQRAAALQSVEPSGYRLTRELFTSTFSFQQKKASSWCRRGSTHRLSACLQKPSNVIQRITGTASAVMTRLLQSEYILLTYSFCIKFRPVGSLGTVPIAITAWSSTLRPWQTLNAPFRWPQTGPKDTSVRAVLSWAWRWDTACNQRNICWITLDLKSLY